MSTTKAPSSLSSPVVSVDPSSPGTIIRYAFALEGALNILGALPMLFYPAGLLSYLVASPSQITPASVSMMQWVGGLTLGLTPQLFLAIPNTRRAIESRRMVYITLGAGEAVLVPLFLWQAYVSKDGVGFSAKGLVFLAQQLVLPAVLRVYVLWWKPSLFGRYVEGGKTR